MTSTLAQRYPEPFRNVADLTAAILNNVHDDGSVSDGYDAAVIEMGATAQTVFVLTQWAQLVACTGLDGASIIGQHTFAGDGYTANELAEALRYAATVIDAVYAHTDPRELLERVNDVQRGLSNPQAWTLIACLAGVTKPVLQAAGGLRHVLDTAAVLERCAAFEHDAVAVVPAALVLAAIKQGQQETARQWLGVNVARHGPNTFVSLLLQFCLQRPSGETLLIQLDHTGLPHQVITSTQDMPPTDLVRRLLNAVHHGDIDEIETAGTELQALPWADFAVLAWHLAVSVGVRMGQDDATASAGA